MLAHDHACVIYRSEEERVDAAATFVRGSLAKGLRVVYITADPSPEGVLDDLAREGIDVRERVATGQLDLRDAADALPAGAPFDPGAMIELLRSEVQTAIGDGWNGLRVAGEAWALGATGSIDALPEYERRVEDMIRETEMSALCLYDSRRFHTRACDEAAQIHPLVLSEPNGNPCSGWELGRIERTPEGTLAMSGEVDLSNSPSVVASLRAEAARTPTVRVDMRELSFIDVTGLGGLYEVGTELAQRGGRMSLGSPPPHTRTAMELLGLADADWLTWESA